MIADTSFVIGLLNSEDRHHTDARRLFSRHSPVTLQQPTLAEVLQVVHYRALRAGPRRSAAKAEREALGLMIDVFRFHVAPVEDLDLAVRLFRKHTGLSFVDACAIADARSAGGVLTFDDEQKRLAGAL